MLPFITLWSPQTFTNSLYNLLSTTAHFLRLNVSNCTNVLLRPLLAGQNTFRSGNNVVSNVRLIRHFIDSCHLLQVHLMYEEVTSLPQSPLVSLLSPHMMTHPETRVLDMDTMILTGGETELSILTPATSPGHQYIVCAELRLGDVTLQTECFLSSLDSANGDKYFCYCAIKIFFRLSIRTGSECHHRNKFGSQNWQKANFGVL